MDTVPMWMKNLDDEDMIFIKKIILILFAKNVEIFWI